MKRQLELNGDREQRELAVFLQADTGPVVASEENEKRGLFFSVEVEKVTGPSSQTH